MSLPPLRVSDDRRNLSTADGRPFFYLADTAWELFHRLSREQATMYLEDRAAKGFTVIQAVALAELDGLRSPTPGGHLPLHHLDPTRPNEAYFEDVDFVVQEANRLGMYVGLLPTWGDKWNLAWGQGPAIFNATNARDFGEFLGRRYRDAGIIWILGGDRVVTRPEHAEVIRAMAAGLKEGDGGAHLMTFHPQGQYSSACYFHDDEWLDFHMVQTGHTRDRDNYHSVAAEFGRIPPKPVLDGEPGYENIGHSFDASLGRLDAHQCRKFAYWSLMSGACGHTYGCSEIWQMYDVGREPVLSAETPWHQAIHFPGSGQMRYARQLIEDNDFWDRLPDQSLVEGLNPTGPEHIRACRAADGNFALLYFPTARPANVRLFLMLSRKVSVAWFNPRNGESTEPQEMECKDYTYHLFQPPGPGDWVLVLRRIEGLW